MTEALGPELLAVGQAVGLLDGGGSLDPNWFSDPLSHLETILSNQPQRDSLLQMLDFLLPPQTVTGLPSGEKWHPLLGSQPNGNLYLTVAEDSSGVLVGLAGEFGATGAPPTGSLRARLPLVRTSGSTVSAAAATAGAPLTVALHVDLGWTLPAQPIGLSGISVAASLVLLPPGSEATSVVITLEALQLDAQHTAQDMILDTDNIGDQAAQLALGLVRANLSLLSAPTGEAAAVADHLLGLFGIGDSLPPFPLAQGPTALRGWLAQLAQGGAAAPVKDWLGHLAGLLGASAPTPAGDGTADSPWSVPVLDLNTNSALELTLSLAEGQGAQRLLPGLRVRLAPAASTPARVLAQATLAAIPLGGSASAAVLPSAAILMHAPGQDGAPDLVHNSTVTLHSVQAGLAWDGSLLRPLLELDGVTFEGQTYQRVDLTNTESVVATASNALKTEIVNALGGTGSAGGHLAALTGLVPPASDPTTPHAINPAMLFSDPAGAIAAYHLDVLKDASHSWAALLEEVAGLLGLSGGVSGHGTPDDPWRVSLGTAGPLDLAVTAWDANPTGAGGQPHGLRLGLGVFADHPPLSFTWLAEALAFDLPGSARVLGAQHVRLRAQPIPAFTGDSGFAVSADAFQAGADWTPGGALTWQAGVKNLALSAGGTSVTVPALAYPALAGFDASNPAAAAAALGVSTADLEKLLRLLLAQAAANWGGQPASVIAALAGLHNNLPGLPDTWPVLSGSSGPGTLLSDPLTALRDWLHHIAVDVDATGAPYLSAGLPWLRALLSGSLPTPGAAPLALAGRGSGNYDDPWSLPLDDLSSAGAELLAWLEPAGPPAAWASALAAQATAAGDYLALVVVLAAYAAFDPDLRAALADLDPDGLANALFELDTHLSLSDGVVPTASQIPTGGAWTSGTPLQSAHPAQPQDPSAISQILAQIDTWAGGPSAPRAVLLLGPAFSDHHAWDALLASPLRHGTTDPSATFNLRLPGVDPATIDLSSVSTAVDYYTADLQDDGSGNLSGLLAQVGRVAARIAELRPGIALTLVAHSTAGVVARVYAAGAASGQVKGLITLGAPHQGAPLPFLTDPTIAAAARLAQAVLPADPGSDAARLALAHIFQALDGCLPPAAAGQLPRPAPYPVASFDMASQPTAGDPTNTGGVPALALGGSLSGTLLQTLKDSLSAKATATAAGGTTASAPTHLAFGFRARLGYATAAVGPVQVDARMRFDLFQIPLAGGAAQPPHPAQALHVRARLYRPDDWLVGGPGAYAGLGLAPVDVRVRWVELGADLETAGSALHVAPFLALHQAAFHGPQIAGASFSDPQAQALLGAVLQSLTATPLTPGTRLAELLADLQSLGIVVADPHGGLGVSADAFNALAADAAGYLRARFAAALDASGGLAGLAGPAGGPWTLQPSALPIQVSLERAKSPAPPGWAVRLDAPDLPLASQAALAFSASLALPGLAVSGSAALSLGGFALAWDSSKGQVNLQAGCLGQVPLYPTPQPADLHAALNHLLPNTLFSAAASAALEAASGQPLSVAPLACFFESPGQSITHSPALGNGTGLDSSKITLLLQALNHVLGNPVGPGLALPGGLQITAAGAGTDADPVRLELATTAPLGGVLGVQFGVAFDSHLHPTPTGGLALTISGLPAAAPAPFNWTGISAAFGVSPAGATLTITPQPGDPIKILPNFGGLGGLIGNLTGLLPCALDEIVTALSQPGPQPELLHLALELAGALGIYDSSGGFSAHTDKLRAMLQDDWTTALGLTGSAQSQAAQSIAGLFSGSSPLAGALPGTITASGSTVAWAFPLPSGVGSGSLTARLGWDGSGPTLTVGAQDARLTSGALECSLAAGYGGGSVTFNTQVGLRLQQALGLDVTPCLSFDLAGGKVAAWLLPLANGSDGPMRVDLAPTPGITLASGGALGLVDDWLIPLAADLLFSAAKPHLTDALWTGGKTLEDLLVSAGLVTKGANPTLDTLIHPIPDWTVMLGGVLQSFTGGMSVPLSSTLNLDLVSDSGRMGVGLKGSQSVPVGDLTIHLNFGAPADWGPGADEGLALYLFQSGSGSFTFNPGLHFAGVGFGLSGSDDKPLLNTSGFRLGEVDGHIFMTLDFSPSIALEDLSNGHVSGGMSVGGGVVLRDVGLPLGQATGGNVGGDNPVAASLMRNDSGAGGDSHTVAPGIESVEVWDIDGQFHISFGGSAGPVWIGVHGGFGPIYIDQIGLAMTDEPAAEMLIDGSVKVDGLTAQADELTVVMPLKSLATPANWRLDLKGLGIGFESTGVSIAGALLKSDGPPVEYDGLLLVELEDFGIVAIGAYSTPGSGVDRYTSLFVFAGVFIPIGFPPLIEISGLGLGMGYNRELIVPDDLNQVPNFVLVAALDDPGRIADDPMGMLMQIAQSIPAKRGSFWLAFGLRGTSFEIVHVTAIVYVSLDRGVEVGLLGVARMALPTDDTALVSVELALKARFSTAEGLLSIQAQLTDNSWLLSPDCQLTGGFAYFMWFTRSQFVLTLGGYNPTFQKPTEFPDVPRLGYHWSLLGAIAIKGESYFALTNTCVMAGTRFDATYGPDWIQVWFSAYADLLVSWDPFFYSVHVGITVGARFHIDVCFFGACATIDVSVSLGASLLVEGPPFHGTVTVDLDVASVTVAFGPDPAPQPDYIQDWNVFALKYLQDGDSNTLAAVNHLLSGLLPPDPPGGQPSPGTQDQPWKISSEFSFQTETKMPARAYRDFLGEDSGELSTTNDLAINPMGKENVTSVHVVGLEGWDDQKRAWVAMSTTAADPRFQLLADHFKIDPVIGQVSEATWSYIDPSNVPAAARTVPELLGLTIAGFAVAQNASALIPIGRLVDDGAPRPLPFAIAQDIPTLKQYGQLADNIVALAASSGPVQVVGAARAVLADNPFFARVRQDTGLPQSGLAPMAARALSHYRSAPPLFAPMTTGLTMKPVGQAAPPVISRLPLQLPVELAQPRLRAVLLGPAAPTTDAPPALRTTVFKVAPQASALAPAKAEAAFASATAASAAIPRLTPPSLDTIPGARLQRVPAAGAPRPTSLTRPGRTLRSPELGWTAGAAHSTAMQAAEKAISANGVTLPSGATHFWDLPGRNTGTQNPSGGAPGASTANPNAAANTAGVVVLTVPDVIGPFNRPVPAARVTFLSRGGQVLEDVEIVVTQPVKLPIPSGSAMLAVTCLGTLLGAPLPGAPLPGAPLPGAPLPGGPAGFAVQPGFGAVSSLAAPGGQMPACGWQSHTLLAQAGATSLLARGSVIALPGAFISKPGRQPAAQAMVRAADALSAQTGAETRLPITTQVVLVLLDQQDPSAGRTCNPGDAAQPTDLAVAAQNAELSAPLQVTGGRRAALLYNVLKADTQAAYLSVAPASRGGWAISGVIGLPGRAKEWAARMNGGIPEHIIPEGPLTPGGQVTVQILLNQLEASHG